MEFQNVQDKFVYFRTFKYKLKISGQVGGMPLVGWQEGHPIFKITAIKFPEFFQSSWKKKIKGTTADPGSRGK